MAEYHSFRDDPLLMLKRNLGFVYKYSFAWVFSYYFSKNREDIESDLPSFLPQVRQYDKQIGIDSDIPRNLYKLILGLAGWDLVKISGFVLGKKLCDMMVISRMWNMSDEIKKGNGDINLLINTLPWIYALDFLGIIFLSYAEMLSLEVGFSLRALLNLMVYRKILKFRLLYNKDTQEAMFVGFTQSDSVTVTNVFDIVKNYIDGLLNVLIFAIWGGMYFGFPIVILVSIFLVQQFISIFLVTRLSDIQRRYLATKGDRTKHSKSMVNCMPLVKIFGLESLLFLTISLERVKEMGEFVQGAIKRSMVTFINWGSVYFAFCIMLVYLFAMGQGIQYAFMVPMTKMMMLLFYTTGAIPKATEASINLRVSFERIQRFLDLEDIIPLRVKAAEGEEESIKPHTGAPIRVENCQFTWKKPPAPVPVQGATELQPLNVDKTFGFKSVDIKLEKGELAMIVGRVGSGKSSVLLSLFNEMQHTNPKESCKYVSDNCVYLAQRPWIMNRTIKENIVLNNEFDEELFKIALQVASLTDEIAKMPEKEETICGKRGEKLSGGQRWLISLARAYYQQ